MLLIFNDILLFASQLSCNEKTTMEISLHLTYAYSVILSIYICDYNPLYDIFLCMADRNTHENLLEEKVQIQFIQ